MCTRNIIRLRNEIIRLRNEIIRLKNKSFVRRTIYSFEKQDYSVWKQILCFRNEWFVSQTVATHYKLRSHINKCNPSCLGPPGSVTTETILFCVRILGFVWITHLCDKHFQLSVMCLFDTFPCKWNYQSHLHVSGRVSRWVILKWFAGGGHWTFELWLVHISCFQCVLFERLHCWIWL